MVKLYTKITKCRISNDKKLIKVCDFGNIKLTGVFPKNRKKKIKSTPLQVVFSNKSKLLQLNHNYNFSELFGMNYGYRSGLNQSMVNHLRDKKFKLDKRLKLQKKDSILDIGSNDGTFLKLFSKSINRIGCDPTAKKFKKFYPKSIKVFPKLFNQQSSKFIKGKFKLISCIAMFYDLSNPTEFLKLIEKKIEKNGIFHVEIAYLPLIYKTFSFDTFCQEHLTYYSFKSFENLIKNTNLKILDYEINSINGGSINFNLSLKNSKNKVHSKKLEKLRNFEKKNHYNNIKFVKTFFKKVKKNINKIRKNIKSLNGDVYGFGASTKGNVTLQLCNLNENDIKQIYDINKNKFNCYTPGSKIKIVNEKNIIKDKPKYLIFLIWHFKKTIFQKIKKLKLRNTRFIWLFPNYKVTNK
mgnify:CR=1 FL=1|tara:strand:+ start:1130 stop:2359 length:1230 start_codon:yes stop_codon:yes gene_type:complete